MRQFQLSTSLFLCLSLFAQRGAELVAKHVSSSRYFKLQRKCNTGKGQAGILSRVSSHASSGIRQAPCHPDVREHRLQAKLSVRL